MVKDSRLPLLSEIPRPGKFSPRAIRELDLAKFFDSPIDSVMILTDDRAARVDCA